MIGNGVNALLRNPEQLEKYRQNPDGLTKPMVEEVLRYDGPSKMEVRTISEDLSMRGQTLCRGDMAYLVQHAANRDPGQFHNPDLFDIEREPNHHIGFGFGIHFCLGNAVARLETRLALEGLLEVIPDYEIEESGLVRNQLVPTRGVASAPVVFEPASTG